MFFFIAYTKITGDMRVSLTEQLITILMSTIALTVCAASVQEESLTQMHSNSQSGIYFRLRRSDRLMRREIDLNVTPTSSMESSERNQNVQDETERLRNTEKRNDPKTKIKKK